MAYSATFAVPDTHELNQIVLVDLDKTTATEVQTLGSTVTSRDGRRFVHGQYVSVGNLVVVAGMPAIWADCSANDPFLIQADVSAGGADGEMAAGAFCCNIADANTTYCWIQTNGRCRAIVCEDENTAVNDPLMMCTTDTFGTKPIITSTSNAGEYVCGFAISAAYDNGVTTASRCDAVLTCG